MSPIESSAFGQGMAIARKLYYDPDRGKSIGFLEKSGSIWKVPFVFRPGLEIVQGKAE